MISEIACLKKYDGSNNVNNPDNARCVNSIMSESILNDDKKDYTYRQWIKQD